VDFLKNHLCFHSWLVYTLSPFLFMSQGFYSKGLHVLVSQTSYFTSHQRLSMFKCCNSSMVYLNPIRRSSTDQRLTIVVVFKTLWLPRPLNTLYLWLPRIGPDAFRMKRERYSTRYRIVRHCRRHVIVSDGQCSYMLHLTWYLGRGLERFFK
jgi:hypothetical protein